MPGRKDERPSAIFREATLRAFEDASASIVLRRIDHAFERAGIALGSIASDDGGTRRVRFRRYVASVDQRDPPARDRLGDALGALVADVADSKVAFLVSAAERDGFAYAGGVFRPVTTARAAFAVARVEELGSIDERGRRLRLLAETSPDDAVSGAISLVRSVCVVVSRRSDGSPRSTIVGLADLIGATFAALDDSIGRDEADAVEFAAFARSACAMIEGSGERREGVSVRRARLAIDIAVALAAFLAETFGAR